MTSSAQQTAMAFVEARKGDLSAWTKQIFDLGETAGLVQQHGAAERGEAHLAQHLHPPVRPVALAEGDEDIDLGIARLLQPARGHDAERDIGIAGLELADDRAEPEGGEARGAGDGERAADALVVLAQRRIADDRERPAHVIGIAPAARRQADAAALALEELEAELAFQQAQLMADGAAREPQLVGGSPHAAMPREGIERPEGLGGGDTQADLQVKKICRNRENISLFERDIHHYSHQQGGIRQ